MNKKISLAILLLGVLMASAFSGCQPEVISAKFEVTSLQIKPSQITVGETAVVTVTVSNTGGSSGIYNAVLLVDTVKSATKSVQLDPGVSQTVTFSVSKDTAGTYQVEIGDKSTTLTVKLKLVAKQVDLKYDGSFAKDYLGLDKPCTGYLVSFVSPSTQFIINEVQIMGLVYGGRGAQIKDLEVQIWDKDKKVVYSTSLPANKFPQLTFLLSDIENKGDWVDVYIPDVKVEGNFYVHIYTGVTTGQGFRMGVDNSVINTHSDITIRDADGVDNPAPTWPYPGSKWFGDRARVNWMVRASGNAMLPQK